MEKAIENVIRRTPIFTGLSEAHVEVLADCAVMQTCLTHDYLFYAGKPAVTFYVITEGLLAIQTYAGDAGFVEIDRVEAGAVVGWSWLLPPYQWVYSGEAATPITAVRFDGRSLRECCEQDAAFGYNMAIRMTQLAAERLVRTRNVYAKNYVN